MTLLLIILALDTTSIDTTQRARRIARAIQSARQNAQTGRSTQ
jgi:hypothetical protein